MKTLLVVDDDPAIREIFSVLLSMEGYTVHAAAGGRECFECLSSIPPDLVLLDILMHPIDGWETLTAIRKNPETRHIPVIMFSGKSPSCEEIVLYGGWIEDYLMKPISMETITESLDAVFGRCLENQVAGEYFLQNSVKPDIVAEYFHLKNFLLIYGKFSPDFTDSADDTCMNVSSMEARFTELDGILSATRLTGITGSQKYEQG